jgi:hypothetical protein
MAALALSTLAGCSSSTPDIDGRWSSIRCESVPGGNGTTLYRQRAATNTATDSSLTITVFADAACTQKTLTAVIAGPYTVDGPSESVAGAYDAVFQFATITLTPEADMLAGYINGGDCGPGNWKVGVAQDISATGCKLLGFPSTRECAQEYDLLEVDGDQYFYGKRPDDGGLLCTPDRRPKALSPDPLRRAP